MDDIEIVKNLMVKVCIVYSVWDVCWLFIEMIVFDVDIDIESKCKFDELFFLGYVIRFMEFFIIGRLYGFDFSVEDFSVFFDFSVEVILFVVKMVKERFDLIGNGMFFL